MGQAREAMDRLTEAVTTKADPNVLAELFAEDAVAITPDGEFRGRDNDEGFLSGRNTGPIQLPTGETLPPTDKEVRIHGADMAAVEDGRIVSYRVYFDQMEFSQLPRGAYMITAMPARQISAPVTSQRSGR